MIFILPISSSGSDTRKVAGNCLPCILSTGENPKVPPFPVSYAGLSITLGKKSNDFFDKLIKNNKRNGYIMNADQIMAFTSVSQWSCRSSLGSKLLVSTLTSVSRVIWRLLEVSSSSEILFQVLRDPAFMCDLP